MSSLRWTPQALEDVASIRDFIARDTPYSTAREPSSHSPYRGGSDVEEAFRWYEDQRRGLGSEFLLAVEAALAAIECEPELYAPIHRNARRILLRRFPYSRST